MTRDERKEMWVERIRRFRESGETAEAWSETQGLSVSTLRYWIRKCPLDNPSQDWVVFDLDGEGSQPVTTLSLHVGDVKIEVPENFNPQHLSAILGILRKTC